MSERSEFTFWRSRGPGTTQPDFSALKAAMRDLWERCMRDDTERKIERAYERRFGPLADRVLTLWGETGSGDVLFSVEGGAEILVYSTESDAVLMAREIVPDIPPADVPR